MEFRPKVSMFSTRRFLHSANCSKFLRLPGSVSWPAAFILALASHANAGFIGPYALGNFTLINTPTCGGDILNGSATTPDNGNTVVLTGSNSGSGCAGTTDLLTTAQGAGTVQFNYSYSSLDAPGADFAGYLRGSMFTQLADTNGQSGAVSFQVSSGQSFGFRVGTTDNTGEPGVLAVSNFSAPGTVSAVPEPGTIGFAFAGVLTVLIWKQRTFRALWRVEVRG